MTYCGKSIYWRNIQEMYINEYNLTVDNAPKILSCCLLLIVCAFTSVCGCFTARMGKIRRSNSSVYKHNGSIVLNSNSI